MYEYLTTKIKFTKAKAGLLSLTYFLLKPRFLFGELYLCVVASTVNGTLVIFLIGPQLGRYAYHLLHLYRHLVLLSSSVGNWQNHRVP